MPDVKPVLPNSSLIDTVALGVLLTVLPAALSNLVGFCYLVLGNYKQYKFNSLSKVRISVLVALDVILIVVLQFLTPKITNVAIILSKSIISTKFTGYKVLNNLICFVILIYVDYFGIFKDGLNLKFKYLNILISCHIISCQIVLSKKFQKNGDSLTNSFTVLTKNDYYNKIKIEDEVFRLVSLRNFDAEGEEGEEVEIEEEEIHSVFNLKFNSKSFSLFKNNFKIFINSLFTKRLNQPIWLVILIIKSVIYKIDLFIKKYYKDDKSLILFKYDEISKKTPIIINYIGDTLISFQLKHLEELILIKVNGIIWFQVSNGNYNNEEFFLISGLTPLFQYDIQIIMEYKDKMYLIDELMISTNQISNRDHQFYQTEISSPLITLQQSLVTTNDILFKEKLKLKKGKKESSKKLNSIRSEIENLNKKLRLNINDKNDEKSYNKLVSLRNLVELSLQKFKLKEEEYLKIELEENEINEIYLNKKREFDFAFRNHQIFLNNKKKSITEKQNEIDKLDQEIELMQQKLKKLSNKLNKLNQEVSVKNNSINSFIEKFILNMQSTRTKRSEKRNLLLNEFKNEIAKIADSLTKLNLENQSLKSML